MKWMNAVIAVSSAHILKDVWPSCHFIRWQTKVSSSVLF